MFLCKNELETDPKPACSQKAHIYYTYKQPKKFQYDLWTANEIDSNIYTQKKKDIPKLNKKIE
jgi:hypothetical protein